MSVENAQVVITIKDLVAPSLVLLGVLVAQLGMIGVQRIKDRELRRVSLQQKYELLYESVLSADSALFSSFDFDTDIENLYKECESHYKKVVLLSTLYFPELKELCLNYSGSCGALFLIIRVNKVKSESMVEFSKTLDTKEYLSAKEQYLTFEKALITAIQKHSNKYARLNTSKSWFDIT